MAQDEDAIIDYARSIWPASFTRRELCEALGMRVTRLRRIKGLMDTGVRRYDDARKKRPIILWRFKPHQLQLPLGDQHDHS
jgi:hypothetical protein